MGGILCKAKWQIILPISCIYHQTVFWKWLPAAASNAYFFASSAGSNAKMHRVMPVPLLLLLLLACLLDILASPSVSGEL
jgi:hypothetical protein